MASVTLDRVWLNLASDMTQTVSAWSADWSDVPAVRGEVRSYAGGRQRIVRRAGSARKLSLKLLLLSAAQVDTLVAWAGQVVLLRDKRGRKVWVTWFDVPTVDHVDGPYDVTLAVTEVTFSEAV